jgi:hypothetical protein
MENGKVKKKFMTTFGSAEIFIAGQDLHKTKPKPGGKKSARLQIFLERRIEMRTKIFLLVMVVVFFSSLVCAGEEKELTALEVMEKSKEIFRSAKEEKETLEVSLTYADGRRNPLESKKIERKTIFSSDGQDKTEVIYLLPIKEEGKLLRIHRHPDRDDIWLKNPSWKKERMMVGSQMIAPFVWDVTQEDIFQLTGENLPKFDYSFLESEDQDCWLIKAVPKKGTKTGYGHREISIGKEDFAYIEVKYFDHQGKLEKIQTNHDLVFFKNGLWRPDRITVESFRLGRTTEIRVTKREIKEIEVEK